MHAISKSFSQRNFKRMTIIFRAWWLEHSAIPAQGSPASRLHTLPWESHYTRRSGHYSVQSSSKYSHVCSNLRMKVSKLTCDCTSRLPWWKPRQEFDTSDVKNSRLRIENRLFEWARIEDCGRSNKGVRFICNSRWLVRVLVGACWLDTLTSMNVGQHFCLLNCSSTMSLALHFF